MNNSHQGRLFGEFITRRAFRLGTIVFGLDANLSYFNSKQTFMPVIFCADF